MVFLDRRGVIIPESLPEKLMNNRFLQRFRDPRDATSQLTKNRQTPNPPMPKQSQIITVVPFIGGLPLKFGMSPEEVTALVGPPESSRARGTGPGLVEYRPWAKLLYGNQGLDEVD